MSNDITIVSMLRPAFEVVYATAPYCWPRFKPEVEPILITDPFCFASHIRLHTYFGTNQQPVKFVLKTLSHSSSDKFKGELTLPTQTKHDKLVGGLLENTLYSHIDKRHLSQ